MLTAVWALPLMQEYYAPVITAYEAHIALAPGQEWTGEYHMDFTCLLVSCAHQMYSGDHVQQLLNASYEVQHASSLLTANRMQWPCEPPVR